MASEHEKISDDMKNEEREATVGTSQPRKGRKNRREKQAEYRAANREFLREKSKAYYAANSEKIAEYRETYRANNREKINEQDRARYARNRERILKRAAEKKKNFVGRFASENCNLGKSLKMILWTHKQIAEERGRKNVAGFKLHRCMIETGPENWKIVVLSVERSGHEAMEAIKEICEFLDADLNDWVRVR